MANVISARPRDERDSIVARVAYLEDGSGVDFNSTRRLVVLIHGYNTGDAAAARSFAAFRQRLRGAVPHEQIWEFHWPGDHPNRLVSAASYAVRVQSAERAGAALARFLATRPHLSSLCIVAHSLGCRVALETLAQIADEPTYRGPRPEHVFLLAAAVPTRLCRDGRYPYSPPLTDAAQYVFYSTRDAVLAVGFPAMQAVVSLSEEGEAVGYLGRPVSRWRTRTGVCLDHGEYWTSATISREVATTLTLGTAPQALSKRCLGRHRVRALVGISKTLPIRRHFTP